MLLTVDIGNTSIKFGVFDGEKLISKFSTPTDQENVSFDDLKIDSAVVCSVVPAVSEKIKELLKKKFSINAFFVTNDLDFNLEIKYRPLENAGTDRLVNSFAASEKYGAPCIVCSFGTATTVDVVNEKRELIGGLIAPGMKLIAKSLHLNTAKLPEVEITKPDNLIAQTTEDCIRSGIFYSQVGLIETSIERIKKGIDDAKVIATGGFAAMIASETNAIDVVDKDLTLTGLMLVARSYPA